MQWNHLRRARTDQTPEGKPAHLTAFIQRSVLKRCSLANLAGTLALPNPDSAEQC